MTSSDKDLSRLALNVLIYFWQGIPYMEIEVKGSELLSYVEEIDELCDKEYLSRREKSDRFGNKRIFVTATAPAEAMLSLLPPLSDADTQELYNRWQETRPRRRRF